MGSLQSLRDRKFGSSDFDATFTDGQRRVAYSSTVRRLKVSGPPIGSDRLFGICTAVERCTELRVLDLDFEEDFDVAYFLRVSQKLSKLFAFTLDHTPAMEMAAPFLTSALSSWKNLVFLSVSVSAGPRKMSRNKRQFGPRWTPLGKLISLGV